MVGVFVSSAVLYVIGRILGHPRFYRGGQFGSHVGQYEYWDLNFGNAGNLTFWSNRFEDPGALDVFVNLMRNPSLADGGRVRIIGRPIRDRANCPQGQGAPD